MCRALSLIALPVLSFGAASVRIVPAQQPVMAMKLIIKPPNKLLDIPRFNPDVFRHDPMSIKHLIYFSGAGNLKEVKFFIKAGVDVNAYHEGSTALMRASESGNLDVVKYLLENGAKINAHNISGITALLSASLAGQLSVVKYLIKNGAQVKARTFGGGTILMHVADTNNLEVIKCLLKNGANINAKGGDSSTALSSAIGGNHLATVIISIPLVKWKIFKTMAAIIIPVVSPTTQCISEFKLCFQIPLVNVS